MSFLSSLFRSKPAAAVPVPAVGKKNVRPQVNADEYKQAPVAKTTNTAKEVFAIYNVQKATIYVPDKNEKELDEHIKAHGGFDGHSVSEIKAISLIDDALWEQFQGQFYQQALQGHMQYCSWPKNR